MNFQSLDGTSLIALLIFAVIVFAIQVVILRWVFMIHLQVNNQKTMIFLLTKLCENKGIDLSIPEPEIAVTNETKKGKFDFLGVLTERSGDAE